MTAGAGGALLADAGVFVTPHCHDQSGPRQHAGLAIQLGLFTGQACFLSSVDYLQLIIYTNNNSSSVGPLEQLCQPKLCQPHVVKEYRQSRASYKHMGKLASTLIEM